MKKKKIPSKIYMALMMFFLYMPIAVLIIFSFNDGKTTVWKGFTLKWYQELFQDSAIMQSLYNTLIIAVLAAIVATILGTAAALGINNFKGKRRILVQNASNIPIINPDIVTGVSLMLMFTAGGVLLNFEMGFWTVLLAHISFCTPYVILSVMPRLRQMDSHIYEAALDLGCNQWQAFYKVVIHEIMPGILSGFLLSFTYSLDDFVITYFTRGSKFQTLPIQIYTMTHKRISPKINALSALLFVTILVIMIIINLRDRKANRDKSVWFNKIIFKGDWEMKKFISIILSMALCATGAVMFTGCGKSYDGEINVYNWGEYISNGEDDSLDTIKEFEKECNIKVNYTNYETNEEMYNILKNSNSTYDVIIPSDYMVSKLIEEDMLAEINFDNIPNYSNIMDRFKNLEFDKDNKYSIPYSWGVVALGYNKTMMSKPEGFSALWDESLKDNILMFNNSRDAMAIAMQMCGISPSVVTKDDIDKATAKLQEQKPLVKKYVMDQVFTEMEGGQAAIAPYYAGDILTMMDNNEDIDYVLPEEGSNLFVDSMCIPKSSKNKDLAEKFINFMLKAETAKANSEYIGYSTPNQAAFDLLDDDVKNNELIYPSDEYLDKCYTFYNLPDDVYAYMQEQFVKAQS